MYRDLILRMLNRYGRKCEIMPFGSEKKLSVKAIINPLLYKNKLYVGGSYLPDGFYDGGHYLYIGDPKISLESIPVGSTLKVSGNTYLIKHAEQYYIEERPLYSWAVLQLQKRGG